MLLRVVDGLSAFVFGGERTVLVTLFSSSENRKSFVGRVGGGVRDSLVRQKWVFIDIGAINTPVTGFSHGFSLASVLSKVPSMF